LRIGILAVGRLGRAPEAELAADYVERATAAGRSLALGPVELIEIEARKPGKAGEGEALAARLQAGDHLICCDEHGRARSSRAFAEHLGALRDRGVRRLVIMIGGADGLDPELLSRSNETLAFGPQTWPHALARAMLAEQVYRAIAILAGSPYHRD
jgi:23S rRNA (pseudouridine1915-N3)-methyltransferase